MYVYVYEYVYVYVRLYVYAYARVHLHLDICTCWHTCIHLCLLIYVRVLIFVHAHRVTLMVRSRKLHGSGFETDDITAYKIPIAARQGRRSERQKNSTPGLLGEDAPP